MVKSISHKCNKESCQIPQRGQRSVVSRNSQIIKRNNNTRQSHDHQIYSLVRQSCNYYGNQYHQEHMHSQKSANLISFHNKSIINDVRGCKPIKKVGKVHQSKTRTRLYERMPKVFFTVMNKLDVKSCIRNFYISSRIWKNIIPQNSNISLHHEHRSFIKPRRHLYPPLYSWHQEWSQCYQLSPYVRSHLQFSVRLHRI